MEKSAVSDLRETEKREALQRVLASNGFNRSDQLKSLLSYICEREISGRREGLDEYTVAVEALGRPQDYSALEDGTVRNRIHNLRRRLEHYYDVENPDDPVHIELPKGSYCPVFQRQGTRQGVSPPPELQIEIPPAAPPAYGTGREFWSRPVPLHTVCLICALAVAATAGLVTGLRQSGPGVDPVLAEAWGPLLAKNANPLICISTAAQLTLMQRPVEMPRPMATSPDLMAWYRTLPGLPPAKEIYLGPSLTSPFWGDVAGAAAVGQVLSGAGITPELLPEPAIQPPALNKRNLLMFGRPGFSKTIELYLRDKPFSVSIPDQQRTTVIWNAEPKPGEPREYDSHAGAGVGVNGDTAYGLITVMPSWGDANLRTVVFSGTLSPGTQAASEFFSSPKQLQTLLGLFRNEGYSGFPPEYQVVVRSNIFGTSALDVHYVTHRVISKSRN